jgi:hypothetical protein
MAGERTGFAGESHEDHLGDFLRPVVVPAGLVTRRRINQIGVSAHQLGKGGFVAGVGLTAQE